MNLLFVCTGNTCRSPMAEKMINYMLADEGLYDVTASSAGLAAAEGERASDNAVRVMAECSIDLTEHRARCITRELLEQSDLIIPMTHAQYAALASVIGNERLFDYHDQIVDPFGGGVEEYRACRGDLSNLCCAVLDALRTRRREQNDD